MRTTVSGSQDLTLPLSEVELESTRRLKQFLADTLQLLSKHFGGESTLNHLEIGNFIGQISHYEHRPTSNSEISEVLNISRSTVSRIVGDCIEKGWVSERQDPEDGRRKKILMPREHPHADLFERDFRVLVNAILESYSDKEIVQVDPDRKSF
jgi:DNA-binding MarR family transcriptional regulator